MITSILDFSLLKDRFLKKTHTNVENSLICTMYTNMCNQTKNPPENRFICNTLFLHLLYSNQFSTLSIFILSNKGVNILLHSIGKRDK